MQPKTRRVQTLPGAAATFVELLYHSVVRDIRKKSGNAALGFLTVLMQNLVMLAIFSMIYTLLGATTLAIRGDFVLFLLTGIFLFLTHNQAIKSVMGAAAPTDPLMLHSPMNTVLSIMTQALSQLYLQIVTIVLIMFATTLIQGRIEIYNPSGLLFPFFMAWASGIGVGMIFLVLRPMAPKIVPIIAQLYRRANMITSGKMVPANYMTATMVQWFSWNPLFHTIDQIRGEAFVNYFPHRSNMTYPVVFTIITITLGLMAEAWLRKHMSASWGKRTIL